ncbi:Pyrrolidone-carboxylate peptidase (5-oxoprolyl-peptidase) (Pyroglutamyl-peptidase I) (PGP-I) (Pyrase) [Durusdinium trenchii]|uniref:Pyrrolidone-carboxylate peptidase (5-oxoprolyl-peptidase) (Pyroglutamyl-peptidase I) (PGP-I) (Pyrase) n=1 Tax=Durusdinium trenchii TaxID=1381693 RepID=A0ABP0H4P6_9DINO
MAWVVTSEAAILLTGYNRWGNFSQNPSGEVAEALNGSVVEDLLIHSIRIDVSEAGVLEASQMDGLWDAIVHLGFEDEAKGLKLETMAFNARAENKGPVVPTGPKLLPTTGDLGAVALNTKNPHELWSRDAGTFFCNEIYYRTLYQLREREKPTARCRGALVPCLFIHVPPLHQLPLKESSSFVFSLLGDLIRASGRPDLQLSFVLRRTNTPLISFNGVVKWNDC